MLRRSCVIIGTCMRLAWFWFRHRTAQDFHPQFAYQIRKAFEHLGPTFIKLGQMLSLRPDYIPQIYCQELEHLLDSAPPLKFSVVRQIIERELGLPSANIFKKIDRTPLASASISQVHKAELWSGEEVAVKVLRPGLGKLIARDIRLLKIAMRFFGKYVPNIDKGYWLKLVQQLHVWLRQEIDYVYEQKNTKIMRRTLKEIDDIRVPDLHLEYCSNQMLVMELMQGWSLRDLITMKREGNLPELDCDIQERIMYLGDKLFAGSLQNGYVHGDVHPANIFLQKDGTFGLVDFGLIQYFDVKLRNHLALFLIGATYGSPELLLRAARNIASYPDDFEEKYLYAELSELCDEYRDAPPSEMTNGQFLVRCVEQCLQHGVTLPWPIIIFARSTLGFDGIILNLCPEYIFTTHSRSLFVQIYLCNLFEHFCSVPKLMCILDDVVACADDAPESLRTFIDAFKNKVEAT